MGGLDESHLFVGKIAESAFQEIRRGDVVGVENGHEFAVRTFERVVDVAGLGVDMLRTAEVVDAEALGEILDLGAAAVVEDVRLVRIVHVARREHRPMKKVYVLIIRGDEHVHGVAPVNGRRLALMLGVPQVEEEEEETDDAVHFGKQEKE